MISKHKQHALKMVKQSIGTLNKVVQMIEDDTYCFDIMQQMQSVSGMNKKALNALLESHLQTCVKKDFNGNQEEQEKAITEMLRIFNAQ